MQGGLGSLALVIMMMWLQQWDVGCCRFAVARG